MKRTHVTRVIILLIIGLLILQYFEKRNALQCYAMQLADRLEYAYTAGFASQEEIRDIVWDDTVADFYGQEWRASLDHIINAIFMGGGRANQVVARLLSPLQDSSGFICGSSIEWTIWHKTEMSDYDQHFTGVDIQTGYGVTIALEAIPPEELKHYEVGASVLSFRNSWEDDRSTWISQYRDAGSVSAREWLEGKTVPDFWSGWFAAWLENWQAIETDDDAE